MEEKKMKKNEMNYKFLRDSHISGMSVVESDFVIDTILKAKPKEEKK